MVTLLDPVSRITTPEPAANHAPSFAPPDTRYAPGLGLARKLGWFSIGLGLAEVLMPRVMANLTGVHNCGLLRVYGLREIVCGLGALSSERPVGWMAARLAGDALDLATLAAADDGSRALRAAAAVAGVTLLDGIAAAQLGAAAAFEGTA